MTTTDGVVRKRAAVGPISEPEAGALFGALDSFPALVLAVSGGPDSTALMWLAARWRDGLRQPPKLIAVTVDHGLRKESAREAKAVAKLAKALKVEHRTLRWTGRKPKTGIQEAARNARYRLLAQAAKEADARHILTAHTRNDQAETVLFRLSRGSGIAGLAGMGFSDVVPLKEEQGIRLIRPFLGVPKARLIATLKAAKVPYATDPSNSDPRFARPRLRKLMALLAREGLTDERLAKLAARAQRVEDALFAVLNDAQATLWPGPWSPGNPATIDAEAFRDLPDEIGLRLLQRMINLIGDEGPAELGQLETLYIEIVRAGDGLWIGEGGDLRRTLAGALVTFKGTKLTVERAPPRRSGQNRSKRKPPFTKPR
jgi:tRNA(Ile)-lysidine synthase